MRRTPKGLGLDVERAELARWQDIRYLATGTESQQRAFAVLNRLGILDVIAPFDAVLIGTFPIDLDIPGSDLDIACSVADLDTLAAQLTVLYGSYQSYAMHRSEHGGGTALVVNFEAEGLPIQVFAQGLAVTRQRGYRHMLIEARLLALAGPAVRAALRALKTAGLKTEPAFAHYFHLSGDPYETLYALSNWPLDRLAIWYSSHQQE